MVLLWGSLTGQRFYRLLEGSQATETDFVSHAVKYPERPTPNDSQLREMWDGVSLWDSLDRTRRMAPKLKPPATHAAVFVPRPGIRIEQRGRKGHYTAWGAPGTLLGCVVNVVKL
jgi:hypothetical protein